ncbi:MAG: hypothetical protein JWR72_3464 [Flavisolibacter sp.]|nr:hypothetical protein [Flavisolibacter sp.]
MVYSIGFKTVRFTSSILFSFFLVGCSSYHFASVKFNAEDVNAQLDSGAKYFVLQFKALNGKNVKKPIELVSYAYVNTLQPPKLNQLISNSVASKFIGELWLGNNTISKAKIEKLIIDSITGKRINYKWLLFTPKKNAQNYIYYSMKAVLEGESTLSKKDEDTEPCPPAVCHVEISK